MSFSHLTKTVLADNALNYMRSSRLAKPRGGRRPGTPGQARVPNAPNMPFNQTQPSLFQSNNSNNINGTQQQQDGFGSSNGAQSNQTSQSFPPFNASSNNGFDTQFNAPSGGFSFSAGQTDSVNNPFANVPAPDTGGFSGSIFNMPAQKGMNSFQKFCEAQQPPLFAAHSPFHNDNQNVSTPNESQPSNNPFNVAGSQPPQQQQQSSQQSSSLFPQQQQQQAPGNMFAPQQPATTAKDIFAPSKQSPSQTPSTSFGQDNSIFQQPQSAQPTATNLFAHLGSTQPSVNFGQSSMSSAPEDHSMMSTSPDTSPQTTPFGVPNGSNAKPQASPTKDTIAPGAGLDFFDSIPSSTTQPSVQPSWSLSKDTSTPGAAGSIFDRVSKPTTEASAAPPSNSIDHSTPSGGGGSLFERITKPTMEANTQLPSTPDSANLFKIPQTSNSSNHISASSGDSQPAKKKLFGHSLAPQAAQPPAKSNTSMFSPVKIPDFSQPASKPAQSTSHISSSSLGGQNASRNGQASASKKRKFGTPPDPFEDCTEDERIQLVTGWRLKLHDAGMQKHLRTSPSENEKAMLIKFYRTREEEIKAAKGGPLLSQGPGSKRKAAEEQYADGAQGKKPRFTSSPRNSEGTLSNGTGLTSSQTSNIFKTILGGSKSQASMVNGTGGTKPASASSNTVQYPSLPSSSNDSSEPSLFQPKPSSTPSMPPPSRSTDVSHSQGLAFPGSLYQPPSKSLFAPRTTDDGESAASFKLPAIGLGMPTPSGSSGHFGFKPTSSNGPSSDATKPSAFRVPAFGASASSTQGNPNTFSTTPQTSSESSVDATKAAPASIAVNVGASTASTPGVLSSFTVTPASSSEAPNNASTPSSFKVPTFGAGAAPNFLAQFGKAAEKTAAEAKQKRKAEDYDSDEEDEGTWERKYEEEQRAKKQKLEEISKSKTAKQINGKWQLVATSGDTSASTDTPKEIPSVSSPSIFDQPRVPLTNGHNIFGHLSGEESGAEGSKTGDADDEDDGQDEGHDDDEQNEDENGDGEEVQEDKPDAKEQKASSNPFEARSSRTASPQANATSRSMFDRISKDGNGNPVREGSKPNEKAASSDSGHNSATFGSSGFSTSNSFVKATGGDSDSTTDKPSSTSSTNISGLPSTKSSPTATKLGESPTGDHTWKADSPIRFGNQSNSPTVNVIAPSPSKSPFSGLFGASKTNTTAEPPPKPASSLFSTSPTKAPTTGFGFAITPANAVKPAETANPVGPVTNLSAPSSSAASATKPAVNLFAMPSNTAPLAKAATSLFALPPNNASPAKPTTNFFASPSYTAFPANPTVRSLAPVSNTASGATSRATSPGATTGESANESTADNDDGALPKDDQVDLMLARPGEENEDILFEVKAKAMIYDPASEGDTKWIVKGIGPLRVMKHRETGSTRLLLRAEPSGRITVNAALLKDMTYESTSAKAIRVPIANATGKIDVYTFKVGNDQDAKDLAGILSANRPS